MLSVRHQDAQEAAAESKQQTHRRGSASGFHGLCPTDLIQLQRLREHSLAVEWMSRLISNHLYSDGNRQTNP